MIKVILLRNGTLMFPVQLTRVGGSQKPTVLRLKPKVLPFPVHRARPSRCAQGGT